MCVGLGFLPVDFVSLHVFLNSLLLTPIFLPLEPLCALNFSQKMPKNCHMFLDSFLVVLRHFHIFYRDKNGRYVFLS